MLRLRCAADKIADTRRRVYHQKISRRQKALRRRAEAARPASIQPYFRIYRRISLVLLLFEDLCQARRPFPLHRGEHREKAPGHSYHGGSALLGKDLLGRDERDRRERRQDPVKVQKRSCRLAPPRSRSRARQGFQPRRDARGQGEHFRRQHPLRRYRRKSCKPGDPRILQRYRLSPEKRLRHDRDRNNLGRAEQPDRRPLFGLGRKTPALGGLFAQRSRRADLVRRLEGDPDLFRRRRDTDASRFQHP